jgi:polyhydroxyalkanoate synthesis regulator phasin
MLIRMLPAALAAALLAAPARAAEAADQAGTNTADIQRQKKELAEMLGQVLDEKLAPLRSDLTTSQVGVLDLKARVKKLEDDLEALRTQVRSMNNQQQVATRQSAGNPAGAAGITPAASSFGRLRFLNDMTVVVNGSTFTAPAGQILDVRVPPGQAFYQILNVNPSMVATNVAANQSVNVRIFPLVP